MNVNFSEIQTQLNNIVFLLSLIVTIFYWVKIIFFPKKQFLISGLVGFYTLNSLLAFELIIRWVDSGHFPLSSLYESLIFLAWCFTCIYVIVENFLRNEFLGVIFSPLILSILGFSSFSLPIELQISKPLVPALQSNWLFMHVSVMMLSYASLLVGSILALSYLIISSVLRKIQNSDLQPNSLSETPVATISQNSANLINSKLNSNFSNYLFIFDNLSYRTIGIGFCFLTLGILSGAVWANETWGSYWSWDPKETWALITWLTFACYLHTRLIYGWEGTKPAKIASFGFILVWICYLGVNLLGKGLHTYGFLS